MKRKNFFRAFWLLMFLGTFVILCGVGFSDGDDAYFYEHTHRLGFFSYLGWRYETWVGRLAGEALVYLTFHLGIWFWRAANALALVLLPIGILKLACLAAGAPEGMTRESGLSGLFAPRLPALPFADYRDAGPGLTAAAVSGYLLMNAMTLGYAAVWVNGSVFYTWTFTCGIYALIPFAELVFAREGQGGRRPDRKKFFYSIPCCIVAAMSIEQMGAVLLVFEALGLIFCICRNRRVDALMAVQTAVTLGAFITLFLAPGNAIRVAEETLAWMPQYAALTTGEHLFITLQWLLSSFANESKLFLCGLWIAGIFLLFFKQDRRKSDFIMGMAAAVFTAASLLPYIGITFLSDFGINLIDITERVLKVPESAGLSGLDFLPFIWWGAALIFTFFYIGKVSGWQITLLLAYLAGIASEAIMYFSPTMYASGARVYYLTDLLYLFIILCLSLGISGKGARNVFYGMLTCMGILHFLYQVPLFLAQLG